MNEGEKYWLTLATKIGCLSCDLYNNNTMKYCPRRKDGSMFCATHRSDVVRNDNVYVLKRVKQDE
jgi:hypothetical protein